MLRDHLDAVNIQLTHKEEVAARMEADEVHHRAPRDKLDVCIYPLSTAEHPKGLVNIATGEVMLNEDINIDQAMELGKKQLEEFEAGWPKTRTCKEQCHHLNCQKEVNQCKWAKDR